MENKATFRSFYISFFAKTKEVWRDLIGSNPSNRFKLLLACALTLTSLWIGFAYANQIGIAGWQFWTWLTCVIGIVCLFFTKRSQPFRPNYLLLLGLLAGALLFRVPGLSWIPGLFHVDESGVAGFARDSLFTNSNVILNPFITGPASQPSLYHYIVYFSMKIFGFTIFGERISSAVIGSLGVLATYLMIKSISGKKVALFSAVMMVAYHFAVHYSRVGLNNIWDTLWVPLMVYGFVKGWKEHWAGGAVIAGFALGFSQYFYLGSKIGFFLLILLVIVLWKQTSNISQKVGFIGIVALVSICIAGPILMFAIINPAAYLDRVNVVWGWKPEAIQAAIGSLNHWQYFWHQIVYSLGVYTIYPDSSGFYGPNIPLLIGPAAILFLGGIAIAITERNWTPITWLLLTSLFGGFLLFSTCFSFLLTDFM